MQYHDLYVLPYNKKLYKAVLQINIYIFSSLNKKQNNNFGIRRLITSTSVRNSSKLSHTWQSARCVELLDWSDFTKANTCTKTPKSVREGAFKVDPDFVSWKQLNTFLSNRGWKMKWKLLSVFILIHGFVNTNLLATIWACSLECHQVIPP